MTRLALAKTRTEPVICASCGAPLASGNRRPPKYCGAACKKQAHRGRSVAPTTLPARVVAETPQKAISGTKNHSDFNSLQGPKNDLGNRSLAWVQVNAVTWKLTDGSASRTPACHGQWGGYNTEAALAWIINAGWVTGHGCWFARCDSKTWGPGTFAQAKAAACRLVEGDDSEAKRGRLNLNGIAAALIDRAVVSSGDGVRSFVTQLAKSALVRSS